MIDWQPEDPLFGYSRHLTPRSDNLIYHHNLLGMSPVRLRVSCIQVLPISRLSNVLTDAFLQSSIYLL